MDIEFSFQKPGRVAHRKLVEQTLVKLFRKEGKEVNSLAIIFCTDEYLLSINQQFLKHDTYTDIISFNYAELNYAVLGELYISIDRVKENARQLKVSFEQERCRVIFHGALHFCGYKDKTPDQVLLMRKKEEQYLTLYKKAVLAEQER